jgi:sulfite exporter TauE/SafE/copper chaperone CopZ
MLTRTRKLSIGGMHCRGCAVAIEEAVAGLPGVRAAKADYEAGQLQVTFDLARISPDRIAEAVTARGYDCSPLDTGDSRTRTWVRALGVSMGIAALGWLLAEGDSLADRFHLPRFERGMSYGLLFLVGLFTGLHCIGMCGGFVVGYTARAATAGRYGLILPHVLYGLGKTLSYTLMGGAFGLLGSFVAFTPEIRGYAAAAAGVFLVLFGINMLDWFPALHRIGLRMPRSLARFVGSEARRRKSPFILGLLNGLMIACGPLQALYVMAAGTGSFREGAQLLLVFGLGTLPLMFGFGLLAGTVSGRVTHRLLKASALLVVALGLIMLNRGLVLTGSGRDFRSLATLAAVHWHQLEERFAPRLVEGRQVIRMTVTAEGYQPNRFVLKEGVPVRWIIEGQALNACNHRIVVPALGLEIEIKPGANSVEFTPQRPGVIPWSCSMGMLQGAFVVEPAEARPPAPGTGQSAVPRRGD